MPIWSPSPEWKDQDAILVGGGPSLKHFDFSFLRGRNTIGCNDAFHLGPEIIKICLFGDSSWWENNKWELEKFPGRVATCNHTLLSLNLSWLLQFKRIRDGLHEGDTLGWNYSTGAAAINLAYSLGASRIFLLGYDMGMTNGSNHWHSYSAKPPNVASYQRFSRGFHTLANSLKRFPQVKVFNVTDGSSLLPVFDRITFQEFKEAITIVEVRV